MVYLCNAFSLNMLINPKDVSVQIKEVSSSEVSDALTNGKLTSAVGHADTARVFSSILGADVQANRCNVELNHSDECYVGQYIGPRLPEGATQLPEGAKILWYRIKVTINKT
jgi:hypothetical protein